METGFYIIYGIVWLSISNIVLIVNILPRLLAVYKNQEDKYKLSEQEIMKMELKTIIRQKTKKSFAESQRIKDIKKTHLQTLEEIALSSNSNFRR